MGGVADGASETGSDVIVVLIPACVLHDLVGEVVAFSAQCVGSGDAHVGRIEGENCSSWVCGSAGLAELIAPLEDMCPG